MISGASGAFKSRVMLFLFRAYTFQWTLTPASRQSRRVSPRPGASTFTTSAPKSASWRLSMLPATSREKSSTRTPRSGPSASGSNRCVGMGIAVRWPDRGGCAWRVRQPQLQQAGLDGVLGGPDPGPGWSAPA